MKNAEQRFSEIEAKLKLEVENIVFDTDFVDLDDGKHLASCDFLGIYSYGATAEAALENAKIEAVGTILQKMSLLEEVLEHQKNRFNILNAK